MSPPRVYPDLGIHSEQFALVKGIDTLSFEIVTTCFGRMISDIDMPASKGHLHYEFEFGASRFPRMLSAGVWGGGAPVTGRPTQITKTVIGGDSIITEVWRGPDHQVQRFAAGPRTFPWVSGYVGLLAQLVQLLASEPEANAGVRLFFIATGGHTETARLLRRTADSVVVQIDTSTVRARVSSSRGFEGAIVGTSGVRVERLPFTGFDVANRRCGTGPFLPDSIK